MPSLRPTSLQLSRRDFLVAGAGLVVAAACGGSDDGNGASGATTTSTAGGTGAAGDADGPVLLKHFDANRIPAGEEVRLAFGVADADGVPLASGPSGLDLVVVPEQGPAVATVTATRHGEGIPRPYYPVRVTLPGPGLYQVETEIDGRPLTSAIQAVPPEQASPGPGPGDSMIPVATPTPENPRGVEPICTRNPPCGLHGVSLDAALQAGRPVAFLIATPAFCQIRICGPVVDVLEAEMATYGDRVDLLHAEVYTDLQAQETTEAVKAYEIASEPILYLAGADGVIRQRLDIIFDAVELRAGLDELVA